jgi:excisionase family DNA binding protein
MDSLSDLLKPCELARLLRVDPKTVSRWAQAGRIPSIRTPGGHARFRRSDVDAILNPVVFVDQGSSVLRMRNGVKEGAVWGPAVDDPQVWFAVRTDVNGGQPGRFPSKDAAIEFLKAVNV